MAQSNGVEGSNSAPAVEQEGVDSSAFELEQEPSDSPRTPEFIQKLLPSAERTALLYHLCYLSLGRFPKLQSLIREQALETQQLFGSSEDFLMKCVSTISNLDSSLFPILTKVAEKNKPLLVLMYLGKVRTWIDDIIRAVDDMVKRYKQHIQSVRICMSAVFVEHKETDVQKCLSRIQLILIELQKFWEKVGDLLNTLKNQTFAGEDLIEDLDELKEEFLSSIEEAREYWKTFGVSCRRAQGVFSVQSEDAYKFLDINLTLLSEKEWMEQYKSVMEKLKQISPQYSSTE